MATITLQGNEIETVGELPAVGNNAPAFTLPDSGLTEVSLADYADKSVILNIYPSIDTGVCAESARRFNTLAKEQGLNVLCVSADLPFANDRFCASEGLDNVKNLSVFRNPEFGNDYGVTITTGPLHGLLSRAVVAIKDGDVVYTEQVPEIAQEPDYDAALASLS